MEPSPSATLLWFTFRDDAECLLQSVRAARHWAPDSRRVIVQDHAALLPYAVQTALTDLGCEVHTQATDRNGNLNGRDHFDGQLWWMTVASFRHDAEPSRWVIKIDSDTLLNAPLHSWLDLDKGHTAICAWQPTWWFQGPCYAVRTTALPALREHLAAHPQCLRECGPKFPEDTCMGHLITHANGPKSILSLPGGHTSTLFTGHQIASYNYHTWPDFTLFEPFRTLHFGNRDQLPPHMPGPTRRLTAAHTMEAFLDWRGVPA